MVPEKCGRFQEGFPVFPEESSIYFVLAPFFWGEWGPKPVVVSSGDEGRHWTTCLHRRWKLMKIVSQYWLGLKKILQSPRPGLPGRLCQLNIWKTRNPSQCTVLIWISNPGKQKTCFSEWMIHVFAVCFVVNCMLLQCCCDMFSLAAGRDQVELIMLMDKSKNTSYDRIHLRGCQFCLMSILQFGLLLSTTILLVPPNPLNLPMKVITFSTRSKV